MPSPHTSAWLSTPLNALPSYLCLALYSSQCPPLIPLSGFPLLSVSSPAWLLSMPSPHTSAWLLSMPSPHTSAWISTPLSVLPSYLCLALHSSQGPPLIPLPGSPLYCCAYYWKYHCFNDMYTEKSPSQLSACARHASMFVPYTSTCCLLFVHF